MTTTLRPANLAATVAGEGCAGFCRISEKLAGVFAGMPMLLTTSERKIMRTLATLAIAAGIILTCHEGAAAMPAGTAMKEAATAASMKQTVQRGHFWADRIDRARSDADTARQTGQQSHKRGTRKH